MIKENQQKILYENNKVRLNTGFTLFMDDTLIGYTTAMTCKGICFPLEIGKFFNLPKTSEEKFNIVVDYMFEGLEKKDLLKVDSSIYLENSYYINRKKEKKPRTVVYLKPIDPKVLSNLRKLVQQHKKISYRFTNQLVPTEYHLKIKKLRENTGQDLNLDLTSLELIVIGGWQNAQFEIYRNNNGQIFIRSNAQITQWGKVTISSELNNHIENFFEYTEFLCKKDNEPSIIIPTVIREIESKIKMQVNFPYYSEDNKQITLLITHPDFKLTPPTIADYELKCFLRELGYPIKSFYSRYFNGKHDNEIIEESMRVVVREAFKSENYSIFPDVQLVIDNPFENEIGNKHVFDDFIIDRKDNSLILIEYKTTFGRHAKYRETDYAIARLAHFKKKLGEKISLILIINGELYNNHENVTKKFGKAINLVLIGKNELKELKQNPSLLIERLAEVKKVKLFNYKNSINETKEDLLYTSLKKLQTEEKCFLEKNKGIVVNKIPNNFSFYSQHTVNNVGGKFEEEVKQLLQKEGFDVVSNLVICYYNRRMEIDLMGFKNDQLLVASCRRALDVHCLKSFRLDIRQKAHQIEHRKLLLNADSARLYIKLKKGDFERLKDYSGTWVDGVEIIFVLK
ncbi:MAG: hypothetical protein ACFFDW_13735 [Candidatus Thorarchaeota archaeon]